MADSRDTDSLVRIGHGAGASGIRRARGRSARHVLFPQRRAHRQPHEERIVRLVEEAARAEDPRAARFERHPVAVVEPRERPDGKAAVFAALPQPAPRDSQRGREGAREHVLERQVCPRRDRCQWSRPRATRRRRARTSARRRRPTHTPGSRSRPSSHRVRDRSRALRLGRPRGPRRRGSRPRERSKASSRAARAASRMATGAMSAAAGAVSDAKVANTKKPATAARTAELFTSMLIPRESPHRRSTRVRR